MEPQYMKFLEEQWERAKRANSHKLVDDNGTELGLIIGYWLAQRMYPNATEEHLTDAMFYVRMGTENVPIYVDAYLYPYDTVHSAYIGTPTKE